ncbi:MAG TPA: hypothetical protein VML50_09770 [Anaeromyxobacter sp.]|nr:hypothetical protein [Anaeromyxobacter sp.]
MRPPVRRLGAARALLLALALGALPAGAAGPGPLPVRLEARAGRLEAALDLSAVVAPGLEKQLGNGLTNVIALYVTVAPAGGGDVVALQGRVIEILFDVWEESYAVTVGDARAPQEIRRSFPDFRALRAFLADQEGIDLGPLAQLPVGPLVVEARVEVNPVSREQLQRTREYIANPVGGRPGGGGARSVLGAVASFLLREPDPGSDVHLLRSRPFERAEVTAR